MSNKVPQIRFNGYSDAWVQRNLGDITAWTKGQGLPKEDLNEEKSGLEAVHYADLYKFSPVMHEVIHWTNSDDGRVIPNNSLLFPASDVTPVGLARTSTLKLSGVKAGGDVIIGQLDESINSSFMSYQINATSKKILPLITGTTVKHVQAKSLATLSVSVTNMAEQTAIAGLFERIDKLIAANQRKLDLLKEQKKGYLQKMFPKNGAKVPELRFAGFADDWEERKLGDLGSVAMNKRIFKEQTSDVGDIPFYKIGTFGGTPDAFISRDIFEEYKSKYQYPEVGDILISASGSIGRTVVYRGDDEYFQDSNIVWLKHDQQLDNSFLKQFYSIVKWKGLEGSTIKRLYNKNILETKITLPSPEEQAQLGSFFQQLDNTIDLHQRKLDLLKEQKKGFLQKMFV